jgi:phosphatidylserine/phosphatidylglycerophosphate/cardiolipin synthase-like enzyme
MEKAMKVWSKWVLMAIAVIIVSALVQTARADETAPAAGFSMESCTVRFSPKGGVTDMLVAYIGGASQSIRMLAYNFTSVPVANALIAAYERNVDVVLVLDRSVPTEKNSVLPLIKKAGIPYRIDSTHHIAHNKVILIDGVWIETGSFNYSPNAENFNGENALICRSPEAYTEYRSDWETHWAHSK